VAGINETFDRLDEYLAKMQKDGETKETTPPPLVNTRVFDAPRDLVWEAWTKPKQMAKWWGPNGFTNPVFEMDVRPGGAILIHMKNPRDGSEYPVTGAFLEVVRPERLVFTHCAWDNELLNTVTFSETHGKTTMRLEVALTKSSGWNAQAMEGAKMGFTQSFERLAALLAEVRNG